MVFFKHIDYNNSCKGVFRMCLMVIDICIDEALGLALLVTSACRPLAQAIQLGLYNRENHFALLVGR